MNRSQAEIKIGASEERHMLDRMQGNGVLILGYEYFTVFEKMCVLNELASGLNQAYEAYQLRDKIVLLNFDYIRSHEIPELQFTGPQQNTHVICLLLEDDFEAWTSSSMQQRHEVQHRLRELLEEHLNEVYKNRTIHLLTTWTEARLLANKFLCLAEIESSVEFFDGIRQKDPDNGDDILDYLIASQALINVKNNFGEVRKEILDHGKCEEIIVSGELQNLLKLVLFSSGETNADSPATSRVLIVGCCSNRTFGKFLSDMGIYDECNFKIIETANSSVPVQKRKGRKLYIEEGCTVSGISRQYIFFKRNSDGLLFSLARAEFVQNIFFNRGDILLPGDYVGDGKDGFLEEKDVSFEATPLRRGKSILDINSIGINILKDCSNASEKNLFVLIVTESGEERWRRFAQNCRLVISELLFSNHIDARITELTILKERNAGDTDESGIRICSYGRYSDKKMKYSEEDRANSTILDQLNAIIDLHALVFGETDIRKVPRNSTRRTDGVS